MKRILITGATGFIGSYFISKYSNVYDIKTFSFLNDDFNSLDLSDIDIIIHLSALVHQMGGADKSRYEEVNVLQTSKLALKAKDSGVKHFIFMSSIKVYDENKDIVYNEKSECNPTDDYGKSKLKAENILIDLEDSIFRISIIRTPIVYGYGVKANIKNLVTLVRSIPILPFKNIQNRRSMIYVGNLANFIDSIIKYKYFGTLVITDDELLSTTKLVELISLNLDKKTILLKIELFEYFLKLLKPSFYKRLYSSFEIDSSKLKDELNYKNIYSVEDGIKYMIEGEK